MTSQHPENPTSINEQARLEHIFRGILTPYDAADRNTLEILHSEFPESLVRAEQCVPILRAEYKGEFIPGMAHRLFRRANKTAKRKIEEGDVNPKWITISQAYDLFHGDLDEIEPGTPEHATQELIMNIFDSALYVVAQYSHPPEETS